MSGDISQIVNITITRDSVGLQQKGFGVALILSPNVSWVERIRFYTDLDGVGDDFATTTPEYKQAQALFGQDLKPEKIAVGRCANKPTQKYSIVPVVANSTAYKMRVGANWVTYTSDSSATNDEIVDGLASLINALSGDTTTATTPGSSGSHVLTLTGNAAGNFDAVEVDNPALLGITQDHADPGLAADLAAISLESKAWYFILYAWNSKACALVIAAYAEANKKIYIAQSSDSNNITLAIGADSTTSLMGQTKTSAYERTAVIYHPAPDAFADAAWIGAVAPMDPGSETWNLVTLAGVAAVKLTSTHQTNIEDKQGNHYQEIGGANSTQRGTVASGEYIDVMRFLDWLEARMGEQIFADLRGPKKVPFDDAGLTVVQAGMLAILQQGVKAKGLAADPAPVATVPKAKDVPTADKAARKLTGAKFSGTLAGAVHKVAINGVVSI